MAKMNIIYSYKVDEAYCRTFYTRKIGRRLWFYRPSIQVPLLLVIGVGGWFLLSDLDDPFIRTAFLALLALAFFSSILAPKLLQRAMFRQLRKGPEFGSEVTVEVSEQGLKSSGPLSQGSIDWKAFTGAVRHPDGIMLSRSGAVLWLPDAALQGSTTDDVISLFDAKIDLQRTM